MEYRREIDGLRAVAVLPVILFHGGFGWFRGGFVGVDVFFVISGYLITSIILAEKVAGTFTLAGFYERRARRILPPLFFVLAACMVFGWFFLLPNELRELSRSLTAISIFASNILFGKEANYFATAAELNPLLHTWSLAVEEQFYAAFPLFVLLLWPARNRWLVGFLTIFIVGSISFAFAELRSITNPEITFYLLRARCWELFIGCLIAFMPRLKKDRPPLVFSARASELASLLGIGLIAYSVVAFDKGTRFPSAYTLVPTIGTALVILFAVPSTVVGRLLSHRWLVGLGLISYSAYLWHQPLFAFARLLSFSSPRMIAALAICSLVFAYFTWRFVERPFRDRKRMSRRSIFLSAIAMSAATLATGMTVYMNNGFPNRIGGAELEILAFREYPTTELYRTGKCLLRTDQPITEFSPECDAKDSGQNKKLFLWGDSFGAHLYPGIKALPQYAVEQYTSVCPPLIGILFDYGRDCAAVENLVLEKIRKSQPSLIVISANWRKHRKYLDNIGATLDRVRSLSKDSTIILIGNVPHWEPTLPELLVRSHRKLQAGLRLDNPLLKELRLLDSTLMTSAASHHAHFVAPIEFLCGFRDCLVVASNGDKLEPIAYDYGHLTKGGVDFLISSMGSAFEGH